MTIAKRVLDKKIPPQVPFSTDVAGDSALFYTAAHTIFKTVKKTENFNGFTFKNTAFVFTEAAWSMLFSRDLIEYKSSKGDKYISESALFELLEGILKNMTPMIGPVSLFEWYEKLPGLSMWTTGKNIFVIANSELLDSYDVVREIEYNGFSDDEALEE